MVVFKNILIVVFLFYGLNTFSQESNFSKFKKLSEPEKRWVILHPFIIKKVHAISVEVQQVTDSIYKTGVLDTFPNGGQIDAFRHGYWMLYLSLEIGKRRALSLGKTHEKGNKQDFKKGNLEEKFLPDFVSIQMDLLNNEKGASLAAIDYKTQPTMLTHQRTLISYINKGEFYIIKRNKKGEFVDIDGNSIPTKEWQGKWISSRCLVKSNWEE
ncbi:MAG: hypothetical protein JKY42_11650 [Flavobacteriales bacterium]|nr:hypothetical protein [Flavobacteriales bacterium]